MSELRESPLPKRRELGYVYKPKRRRRVAPRTRRRASPFPKQESTFLKKVKEAVPTAIASVALVGSAGFAADRTIDAFSGESDSPDTKATAASTIQLPENSTFVNPGIRQEYTWEKEEDTFDVIFHGLKGKDLEEARERVREMEDAVDNNPVYKKMAKILAGNYMNVIEDTAKKYGVPAKILIGHLVLEGGEEDRVSEAGAVGIAQFMRPAAIEAGLEIDEEKGIDQRLDPEKSIDAMGYYLSSLIDTFGDVGIGVAAYNWGYGTMYDALRVYFLSTTGKDYGQAYLDDPDNPTPEEETRVKEAAKKYKELVIENKVTIQHILANKDVEIGILDAINKEEARIYAPGVIAAEDFFEEKIRTGEIVLPQATPKTVGNP